MAHKTPPEEEVRHIGHCVYCSNDGSSERLTKEHVIPLSFGGHRYLGAASCGTCRDETHAIEGQCDGTMFKALRVHHEIRTRRPKKRPTHLPILVGATPHDAPREAIPVDKSPGFAPFPIFGPPQILGNEYASNRLDWQGSTICLTTDDTEVRQRLLVAEGRPGALAYAEIPTGPFSRVLAKIAHCYVVSQVGLGGFKPLLNDIILRKYANYAPYYVGGIGHLPCVVANPEPGGLHQICPMTMTIRGIDYIGVQIRLFSYLKPLTPEPFTPVYLVISGEYSGPKGTPHPIFLGQKDFYAQTIKAL